MGIGEELLKQILKGDIVYVRFVAGEYCIVFPSIVAALSFPGSLGTRVTSVIEFLKKWECEKAIIEIKTHSNRKPLQFEVFPTSNPCDIVEKMHIATASIVSAGWDKKKKETNLLPVMTFFP